MAVFKYNDIISEVEKLGCTCPPSNLTDTNLETFRYIFEKDEKSHNHLPNKKISPKRKLKDDSEYCSTCGLSCYDTDVNAVNYFQKLIKNYPNIYKNIGDSLAVGTLKPEHGQMTDIDPAGHESEGHFDFYEYDDFIPNDCFTFVRKLI